MNERCSYDCGALGTIEVRMVSGCVRVLCDHHWQIVSRSGLPVDVLRWLDQPFKPEAPK